MDGHGKNCKSVDQPIAALIRDLRKLGMLDDTLVVWTGEFGRTPFAQGSNGRDHNPFGFTTWFAGGGIKPVLPLEPPMNLGTRRWKTVMKFMTCMLPCYIYLASSTRKVLFASVGVTCV